MEEILIKLEEASKKLKEEYFSRLKKEMEELYASLDKQDLDNSEKLQEVLEKNISEFKEELEGAIKEVLSKLEERSLVIEEKYKGTESNLSNGFEKIFNDILGKIKSFFK